MHALLQYLSKYLSGHSICIMFSNLRCLSPYVLLNPELGPVMWTCARCIACCCSATKGCFSLIKFFARSIYPPPPTLLFIYSHTGLACILPGCYYCYYCSAYNYTALRMTQQSVCCVCETKRSTIRTFQPQYALLYGLLCAYYVYNKFV